MLGLRPGQRRWCPQAWYGQQEQVPIRLLAVWEQGQEEPWYIATSLETAEQTELVYRWRMRLECATRDQKTGVVLRQRGDHHALRNVLHLHRLLLAVGAAEWLCALTGLQAWQDLSTSPAPASDPPREPARAPTPLPDPRPPCVDRPEPGY